MANIVRWDDPFAGLTSLHSRLDDMFNEFFSDLPTVQSGQGVLAMDIYNEDDKQLVAEVHAPGFDKSDVDVSVHNGVRESHAGFYRSLALPKYADTEHADAEFDNGVLKVTVPFKELPEPKKVNISAGKKK